MTQQTLLFVKATQGGNRLECTTRADTLHNRLTRAPLSWTEYEGVSEEDERYRGLKRKLPIGTRQNKEASQMRGHRARRPARWPRGVPTRLDRKVSLFGAVFAEKLGDVGIFFFQSVVQRCMTGLILCIYICAIENKTFCCLPLASKCSSVKRSL